MSETRLERRLQMMLFGEQVDAEKGNRRIGAVRRAGDTWHVWENAEEQWDAVTTETLARILEGFTCHFGGES